MGGRELRWSRPGDGAMTIELRYRIPDWVEPEAVHLITRLPLLVGDVETEYVGEDQEDRETGPDTEVACRG